MEKRSSFLVTHADADSAVVRDVEDAQVHTLAENPGVEAGDALDGTIESDELGVTWDVTDVEDQRSLRVETSEEPPTTQEHDLAAAQESGEVTRRERAGVGELHVLTIPAERVPTAVEDVLDDEETLARATRLGVNRVEIRSDADAGVVSVRYLP